MKCLRILSLLLCCAVFFSACHKKDEIIKTGGKGGNGILRIYPKYFNTPVDSCTVSLKYNTDEQGGTPDEVQQCAVVNGQAVATFTNLHKGTYYIYGLGYSRQYSRVVSGGQSYSFDVEGSYDIQLAVE